MMKSAKQAIFAVLGDARCMQVNFLRLLRTISQLFLLTLNYTHIYLSFKPDSTAGEQDAITAFQDCISDIKSWMIADRLKLNDDKTEFTIIGTRAQLDKDNVSEIVVG